MRLTKDQEETMRAARKAYEGYCQHSNRKSLVTGADLPQWEGLARSVKNAWYAAALKCCNGYGYWAKEKPLDGYKLPKYGECWLYINAAEWPRGIKAVRPREE